MSYNNYSGSSPEGFRWRKASQKAENWQGGICLLSAIIGMIKSFVDAFDVMQAGFVSEIEEFIGNDSGLSYFDWKTFLTGLVVTAIITVALYYIFGALSFGFYTLANILDRQQEILHILKNNESMENEKESNNNSTSQVQKKQGKNMSVEPEVLDDMFVICPNCGKKQMRTRTSCFDCGAQFKRIE